MLRTRALSRQKNCNLSKLEDIATLPDKAAVAVCAIKMKLAMSFIIVWCALNMSFCIYEQLS